MEFRILGYLEVHLDAGPPPRLEPRTARVLAVLLLAANQVVAREHLIDAVWDDAPPATARRQLQNCVSMLRQRMPIVADGPGYRIRVEPGQLDAQRFTDQVTRAQALLSDEQAAEAVRLFRSALACWRGPALAGMTGQVIRAGAARLDEQRLVALETCLDLELRLGRHNEVVGELTELVAAHPLRERPVGQLMLALQRSGRQADALAAYQRLRARLSEELGLDPGADLRDLHTAILRNETPAPAAAPGSAGAVASSRQAGGVPPRPAGGPSVPRQLPAVVRPFVGRAAEMKELTELIDETAQPGGTVVISAIGGMAGVGKTAVAVHWAHQVAHHFPDGQLYVNLRGFDPSRTPMQPAEAIRGFLDALAVPAQQVPANSDAQAALLRSLLSGRRILVLLDNARDAEQVRPLLPGSPTCLVVVTSRNRLTGLVAAEGARPLILDLFSTGEARELLVRRLGPERLAGEPAAVAQLIARCAGLPLALAIVAARAAVHAAAPIGAFAAELAGSDADPSTATPADVHRRLDALDAGDRAMQVRGVFSWSYRRLSHAAARMFRLLGLHPGPDVGVPAAASLAGIPVGRARSLLVELVDAHLLIERLPSRFAFHDLLGAYATELAHGDPDAERHAAIHRMLGHYLHTAHAAALLLHPHDDPIALAPPAEGAVVEDLAGQQSALAWFVAEQAVLVAAIDKAVAAGFDTYAWQLAWMFGDFFSRRGHWHELVAVQQTALLAARRADDRAGQAHAHRYLGHGHLLLGNHPQAYTHYWQALRLFGAVGDRTGQAHAHRNLAWLSERQGEYDQALRHSEEAVQLYRGVANRAGLASALNAVGWCHCLLGDHHRALTVCREALDLQQEIGDRHGEPATWDSIGYVHHQLGEFGEAAGCYQRSIALFDELGDRLSKALAFTHLAEAREAAGDPAAARNAWQAALEILEAMEHPDAEHIRARLNM